MRLLTVADPLLVELTGFTEAPPLSPRVRHHLSVSTAQQGVDQHLQGDASLAHQ